MQLPNVFYTPGSLHAKYCVQYLRYKQIALNIDILVFKDLYRIGLDLILYNV